jgi:hypothetical protein
VLISRLRAEALWMTVFQLDMILILVTLFGTIWLSASLLTARFQHEAFEKDAQLLLLAGVSMAVAAMLSLSWVAYGPMAMPGLALIVAMLVQRAMAACSLRRRIAVLACTGAAILLLVAGKLQHPFQWEGWTDGPISQGTAQPKIQQLENFRLPPPVAAFLDRVTAAVTANSKPRLCCPPRRGRTPRASANGDRILSIQSRAGARPGAPIPQWREQRTARAHQHG